MIVIQPNANPLNERKMETIEAVPVILNILDWEFQGESLSLYLGCKADIDPDKYTHLQFFVGPAKVYEIATGEPEIREIEDVLKNGEHDSHLHIRDAEWTDITTDMLTKFLQSELGESANRKALRQSQERVAWLRGLVLDCPSNTDRQLIFNGMIDDEIAIQQDILPF